MKCCFSGKLPPLGHLGERMAIKIEDICSSQVQLPSLPWLTRWQFRQAERRRAWRRPEAAAEGEVVDTHCSGNNTMTGEMGRSADVNTDVSRGTSWGTDLETGLQAAELSRWSTTDIALSHGVTWNPGKCGMTHIVNQVLHLLISMWWE